MNKIEQILYQILENQKWMIRESRPSGRSEIYTAMQETQDLQNLMMQEHSDGK